MTEEDKLIIRPITKVMTANYLFASGLERIDEIEAVAMVYKWKDGYFSSGWSKMDRSELLRLAAILQAEAVGQWNRE